MDEGIFAETIASSLGEVLIDLFDAIWGGMICLKPVNRRRGRWLSCDGSSISRSEYKALFEIIGTDFGNGDGETSFNLPKLESPHPNMIYVIFNPAGSVSNNED